MSIERDEGVYYVVCDVCGDKADKGYTKSEASRAAKEAGWGCRKVGDGEFEDLCPDCVEQAAAEQLGGIFDT